MSNLAKKIYINKVLVVYILCALFGIYFFLISEMTLVEWLFSSKYIGLYLNSIYVLFIVKRVNLYKSVSVLMRIRLKDEKYTKFLIQSLFLHLALYFALVYLPFLFGFSTHDYLHLFVLYFVSCFIIQFINEIIILLVIYKNLSNFVLSIIILNNFLLQFIVIENLI